MASTKMAIKNQEASMRSYTFRVLPLFFRDKTQYKKTRALSLTNKKVHDEWKAFLYHGPSAIGPRPPHIQDRFWRWKMYRVYVPEEPNKDYRKKMTPGPKYLGPTRLPITGADLTLYRDYRKSNLKK